MFPQRWFYQLPLSALFFIVLVQQISALNVEYCSDINTSSNVKNASIYQSNGLCHDFCTSNYAFAVLQNDGCWCSNYAPATTRTGCTLPCPGYPDDLCGGTGLYGYIQLTISPSGTKGGSSAAPSTSVPQVTVTATPQAVTIVLTPSPSPSPSAPSSSSSSSSSFSSSEKSSTSASSSSTSSSTTPLTTSSKSSSATSTWTPTPVTSLETVTGQIRTVTVTPTVPPTSGSSSGITKNTSSGGGGLSTGAAVGLTVGLVALVAIISSIVYFCLRKKRQEKGEEYNDLSRGGSIAGTGALGGPIPSRTMSENSKYILNTDGRQVVEAWEPGDAPGSRRSRLMPVDPRLDPFAPVYQRGENKSRESVNTIRDDHDYSRRVAQPGPILRATNPDDPDD